MCSQQACGFQAFLVFDAETLPTMFGFCCCFLLLLLQMVGPVEMFAHKHLICVRPASQMTFLFRALMSR